MRITLRNKILHNVTPKYVLIRLHHVAKERDIGITSIPHAYAKLAVVREEKVIVQAERSCLRWCVVRVTNYVFFLPLEQLIAW